MKQKYLSETEKRARESNRRQTRKNGMRRLLDVAFSARDVLFTICYENIYYPIFAQIPKGFGKVFAVDVD